MPIIKNKNNANNLKLILNIKELLPCDISFLLIMM